MAEKPEDQATIDDKISKAKEFYALGCRNYYVKCFTESADDLSEACKLYGEVYGVDGDELGEVYLLYAKALIAVGKNLNYILSLSLFMTQLYGDSRCALLLPHVQLDFNGFL